MPRSPSPYAHGRSEIWGRGTLEKAISREQELLGERLRALRERLRMTQEQASERIGIHTKHLSRIESGGVNVTLATMVAIAIAYGVPVAKLFQGRRSTTKKG